HRRRHRQPDRDVAGRAADSRGHRIVRRGCARPQRGPHLRDDGGGGSDPSAGITGRRRNDELSAEQTRKLIVLAAIWIILLLAPYWMAPLGGYPSLAAPVPVLRLP